MAGIQGFFQFYIFFLIFSEKIKMCYNSVKKTGQVRRKVAVFEDFMKLDIRVGEIIDVQEFPEARRPAYKVWVDFGSEIGIKKSSAQITDLYKPEDITGRQVLGVVNFPPRQIGGFMSEVLVLGIYGEKGVVLIQPDSGAKVKNGDKLG